MECQQFDFIPCGEAPTVDNIWRHYRTGIVGLAAIILFAFFFVDPNSYVNLLLLFSVLGLFLTSITLSNHFITKIHIDTGDHKFYKYYITARGREGVTVLDLNTSKVIYRFNVSRADARWVLKVKDKKSSVEIRETKNPLSKTQKNVFTKAQLNQINTVISSNIQQ